MGNDQLTCSFCEKNQDAVAKLITSPSTGPRAYICDECVRECLKAVAHAPLAHDRAAGAVRCSFCHKSAQTVRMVASGGDPPRARICAECLMVCESILEDSASQESNSG